MNFILLRKTIVQETLAYANSKLKVNPFYLLSEFFMIYFLCSKIDLFLRRVQFLNIYFKYYF